MIVGDRESHPNHFPYPIAHTATADPLTSQCRSSRSHLNSDVEKTDAKADIIGA